MQTYHQDTNPPDKGEVGNTGGYLRDMPWIQSKAVSSRSYVVPTIPQAQLEANAGTKRKI